MPTEPPVKRAIAFFDGQNLFYAVKQAFGYRWPNYDPLALALAVCAFSRVEFARDVFLHGAAQLQGRSVLEPLLEREVGGHGNAGIRTYWRHLKYRNQTVSLPGGGSTVVLVGQEKGIDIRIALDVVRMTRERSFDVALIFSQDQDLSEVADEVKSISRQQNRWIKLACVFPVSPTATNTRGINNTDWLQIDRACYDACLDPTTTGRNRSPDGGGFPSARPAISLPAPAEIALRSRGTPRLANNRLRWVRDYALSRADGRVSLAVAHDALDMLGIDRLGLDPDRSQVSGDDRPGLWRRSGGRGSGCGDVESGPRYVGRRGRALPASQRTGRPHASRPPAYARGIRASAVPAPGRFKPFRPAEYVRGSLPPREPTGSRGHRNGGVPRQPGILRVNAAARGSPTGVWVASSISREVLTLASSRVVSNQQALLGDSLTNAIERIPDKPEDLVKDSHPIRIASNVHII